MAVLFLGAVAIFNADALADLTRSHLDLVALVPEAEGLRPGSAVWVEGVESGTVTGIAFLGTRAAAMGGGTDSAAVAVHIRIDAEAGEVITRGSDVQATRVRFIGQPVINVSAGQPGDPPIRDGDTLVAEPLPDPMALLEQGMALPAALDSMARAVQRIRSMAAGRGARVERLVDRLGAVTAAAGALAEDLEGGSVGLMMDEQRGVAARVGELQSTLSQLAAAASAVVDRYTPGDTATGAPPSELTSAVSSVLARVEELQTELETLQARLGGGSGTLARMQQDSALQVAIQGVQAQIDSLMTEAMSLGFRMLLP